MKKIDYLITTHLHLDHFGGAAELAQLIPIGTVYDNGIPDQNPDNNPNYRIVASPVVFEGVVYAPSRVKPILAIKAGGRGDVTESNKLWAFGNGPDVPTPVTDGKYFYVVDDRGIMWCLDARTGQAIWGPQRIKPGTYSSSPVLADYGCSRIRAPRGRAFSPCCSAFPPGVTLAG